MPRNEIVLQRKERGSCGWYLIDRKYVDEFRLRSIKLDLMSIDREDVWVLKVCRSTFSSEGVSMALASVACRARPSMMIFEGISMKQKEISVFGKMGLSEGRVKQLFLVYSPMMEAEWREWIKWIAKSRLELLVVQSIGLVVQSVGLDVDIAYCLGRSLPLSMSHLSLTHLCLSQRGIESFVEGLEKDTTLTFLKLDGNKITSLRFLKKLLDSCPRLRTLSLASNPIEDKDSFLFSPEVASHTQLENIIFSYQRIPSVESTRLDFWFAAKRDAKKSALFAYLSGRRRYSRVGAGSAIERLFPECDRMVGEFLVGY